MIYPTIFDFILCEDVREEANKKLTILGTFIGSVIAVPSETKAAILNLTLLWIFSDGEGTFTEYAEISGPNGFHLVTHKQLADKPLNGAHVFVLQLKPSPPFAIGKYVTRAFLDAKSYERTFTIVPDPALKQPPTAGPVELVPPKLNG